MGFLKARKEKFQKFLAKLRFSGSCHGRRPSLTGRALGKIMAVMGALFTIQTDLRYDVVRKLYEGGMGIVYEAEQNGARNFVKRVAIKVIRQNYASQKQFIDNF